MSILVLTSDTLIATAATGNIEYNGQFYGTDSNASRAQIQRITQGTAVASTSGTSIDFTSLPNWIKRITVMMNGVSTSGTSLVQIQLGTGSTTYTTSGYTSAGSNGNSPTTVTQTSGLNVDNVANAAFTKTGLGTLANITGNTWVWSFANANSSGPSFGAGGIALAAALTAVRITTVNGTDTFDAGTINILYEG